ncbi:MAG: S1 RNA-binding domain-containing protein [Bacteroidota bacterium]
MLYLGQYNELQILRFTSVGAYLGDEEENDVLLPNKYLEPSFEIGQKLKVFLYLDHDERIVATTETPLLELNTFAYLKAVETTHIGAFLDWGLIKHLFCPFKEQLVKMEEGKYYLVYLYIDDATQRLVASARVRRFLEKEHIVVSEGEEVDLLICDQTELGQNVIVNDTYSGLIFSNHISRLLRRGERCKGYVKVVRPDGKLDVSLEKPGFQKIEPAAETLFKLLQEHEGKLYLTDKSEPDQIRELAGMSKKTFKQAVGNLYKNRLIRLNDDSIEIIV